MALEVYHTQAIFQWSRDRSHMDFYWLADNNLAIHPFRLAEEINVTLFAATPWASRLAACLSIQCWWHRLRTRKIRPEGGPARDAKFSTGSNPGGWPFEMDVEYQAARIKWSFDGDQTGKHQVRIGPLGSGAIQGNTWFIVFQAAVQLFINEHLTTKITSSGIVVMPCINHATTGGTPIEIGQLQWPPSRQITRRARQ